MWLPNAWSRHFFLLLYKNNLISKLLNFQIYSCLQRTSISPFAFLLQLVLFTFCFHEDVIELCLLLLQIDFCLRYVHNHNKNMNLLAGLVWYFQSPESSLLNIPVVDFGRQYYSFQECQAGPHDYQSIMFLWICKLKLEAATN